MSIQSSIRRGVAGLVFAACVTTPLLAAAQSADTAEGGSEANDVEQARKHFGQGLKLYKDGDFDAALVQFDRAYAVKPNFKVLYNIAQCYFELHQYVEARDTLSRYLKDGQGNIEADRRAAVENDLADLQRRIAHLKLNVNVNGATVYVDGKKAGVTPLSAAIDVNEGQRTISIETSDRGSKQRVVRVAGGENQEIAVDFEAPKPNGPSSVGRDLVTRPPRYESHGLGAGFWVSGIGALALGAGAGVTGYLALQAKNDHDQQLKRFGVTQTELDDSRSKAKTFALTTDILAGSAIVCASIATIALLTHDSGSEQVGLGFGAGNVTLHGNF